MVSNQLQELRTQIKEMQACPFCDGVGEVWGLKTEKFEKCPCVDVRDQLLELFNEREIEARIDEHRITNARFSTARYTDPKDKDMTDGYNLCRKEWSRLSHERINELLANKDKEGSE